MPVMKVQEGRESPREEGKGGGRKGLKKKEGKKENNIIPALMFLIKSSFSHFMTILAIFINKIKCARRDIFIANENYSPISFHSNS